MSLHKNPTLKEAVLHLPQKEKDKLLVRLVGKDKMLMKQLHYQLLEDQIDLEQRIETLKNTLTELFADSRTTLKNIPIYSHYKTLQALLRQASGLINEHEKVTKDKFSELECRIYILKEAFERYPRLFEKSAIHTASKLQEYTKSRVKTTVNKFDKLHEDFQFDLREDMEKLLTFAGDHALI
ncbi:hypothetical protein PQ465_01835 [Sphingobacterium oryzagri]|uniref:CHAD domain-containing protein n=1 Tax=Sphingobacterium oryzagri TaxID=3025669 RepID=A0ABY7WKI4_9SPHI|nr:hypothetical protein [Sphingobacterium sp. KACC 22765]WDF69132.1 hypothetical protein PQ465_01835 [Sphingobacterium sp. KACC 22765]